jgi:hypothetical protein
MFNRAIICAPELIFLIRANYAKRRAKSICLEQKNAKFSFGHYRKPRKHAPGIS